MVPRITAEAVATPQTTNATTLQGERNHSAIQPMIASAAVI
jgi:hypothetical protein